MNPERAAWRSRRERFGRRHLLNQDYPYSLIQLELNSKNEGSGVLYQFAML